MSYIINGAEYSIISPVQSVSVNKFNIVVTDQIGSKLFTFSNANESKLFLTWLYQV